MTKLIKSLNSKIYIGNKALWQLNHFLTLHAYKQYFIICDENSLKHCLPLLISNCPPLTEVNIFEIEAGENSKCIEVATQIWQSWMESHASKEALIINLGGGVVSDLGGFCASVFKRGIDFVNVPTSLLAMVDASLGGKTAIDFNGVKNTIGSFYEPKAVFIEPLFLITLPNREIKNGVAEIMKAALIADKKLWLKLQNPDTHIDEALIEQSILIKNKFVSKDPHDLGIRKALNYGHSIGHATEAIGTEFKDPILHGEAVVIGMMIENHIAYQKKLLNKAEMIQINSFFKNSFKPVSISINKLNDIIRLLNNDKKNAKAKWHFSLLKKIGTCQVNVVVNASEVKKAIQYYTRLMA